MEVSLLCWAAALQAGHSSCCKLEQSQRLAGQASLLEQSVEAGCSVGSHLGQQHHLEAVLHLVVEDFVPPSSLLQGQLVGDDELCVEAALLDALEQVVPVLLHRRLATWQQATTVRRASHVQGHVHAACMAGLQSHAAIVKVHVQHTVQHSCRILTDLSAERARHLCSLQPEDLHGARQLGANLAE